MNDDAVNNYAGFRQRAKAFALDYLVILAYLVILTLCFLLLNRFTNGPEWLFADRVRAQVAGFLVLTLPVALYFTINESSARQGTWGKQRLGLRVTDYNWNQIHFFRALARAFLKFMPWEISHTLVWEISFSPGANSVLINYGFAVVYALIGLNIASLIMTRTHQTLYDFLAGTYVLQK